MLFFKSNLIAMPKIGLRFPISRYVFAVIGGAFLLAAPYHEPALFALAWCAFVPLFWTLDQVTTARQAFLYGWVAGSAAHVLGFHWLTYTITVFGGFPYAVSVLVFAVYAALQGLQMAIFAYLVKTLRHGPGCIYPALFWIAAEFLFPLLFPWYL